MERCQSMRNARNEKKNHLHPHNLLGGSKDLDGMVVQGVGHFSTDEVEAPQWVAVKACQLGVVVEQDLDDMAREKDDDRAEKSNLDDV